jgi:hypothetical protein
MSKEMIRNRVTNSDDNHMNKNTSCHWKLSYRETDLQQTKKKLTEYHPVFSEILL